MDSKHKEKHELSTADHTEATDESWDVLNKWTVSQEKYGIHSWDSWNCCNWLFPSRNAVSVCFLNLVMPIKKVGKSLVEDQLKTLNQASMSKAIEDKASNFYKMGNGFMAEKNYSSSYYAYLTSLKEYASIIVSKKVKTSVDSEEALNYLVKKKSYGLNKEVLKRVKVLAERVLKREKLERKDCAFIKEIIVKIRKSF